MYFQMDPSDSRLLLVPQLDRPVGAGCEEEAGHSRRPPHSVDRPDVAAIRVQILLSVRCRAPADDERAISCFPETIFIRPSGPLVEV